MDCPHIPVLWTCMVGGVIGAAIYLRASRRKAASSSFAFAEALSSGAFLAGAIHLVYCLICPEQLVEIFDKANGARLALHPFEVKLDSMHGVEIFFAACTLAYISIRGLHSVWHNPGH